MFGRCDAAAGLDAVSSPRAVIAKKTKASSSAGATTGCHPDSCASNNRMSSFVLMSVTSSAFVIALSLPYPAPSRPFAFQFARFIEP